MNLEKWEWRAHVLYISQMYDNYRKYLSALSLSSLLLLDDIETE